MGTSFGPSYGPPYRRMHERSSIPELSPAETLLAEASVRFPFSQYSDVSDIVDVNGGWGPFNSAQMSNVTVEFNEVGMRLTPTIAEAMNLTLQIEGVASPLSFGADGLTVVEVRRVDELLTVGATYGATDLVSDAENNAAPQFQVFPRIGDPEHVDPQRHFDYTSIYLLDAPDNFDDVADGNVYSEALTAAASTGVLLWIAIIDIATSEIRITRSSPDYATETAVFPFDKEIPDFVAAPQVIDSLYLNSSGTPAEDQTMIEWFAFNRALIVGEVDAIVAHFTA